jgi:hypothetical protein
VDVATARISQDLHVKVDKVGNVKLSEIGNAKLDEISGDGRQAETVKLDEGKHFLAQHVFVGSKPSLHDVISNHAAEAGSLAVLACGPDIFVDDARRAVVDNVTVATGVIEYYEEAFTW